MSKFLQNFNSAGISLFFQILGGDNSLAIPHLSVKDISQVNWGALKQAGLRGCIFDKDNTLCKPFALTVDPALLASLEDCMQVFDGKVVLFSNSAGLEQYDPEGLEADALEKAFGVKVLRHREKKPAGGCGEVEELFGCSSSEVVMVGDRYLTDVVYGNRHGMYTIRPEPLTLEGEPSGVLVARRVEEYFVGRWTGQGLQAPKHALADALSKVQVRKDPAPSSPSKEAPVADAVEAKG